MSKIVLKEEETRRKVLEGINMVADVVKGTLGPCGSTVLIGRPWGNIMVTKDGVTVAREVDISDSSVALGAKMCKEAAEATNGSTGDGTTTATVLVQSLAQQGLQVLAAGTSPVEVTKGINEAITEAIKHLESISEGISSDDIAKLEYVATISGNDPEVGRNVASAWHKASNNGAVILESTSASETEIQLSEGYRFDLGYISHLFVNNQEKDRVEHEDCLILLFEGRIVNGQEIADFLTQWVKTKTPLLIIADDIAGDALATLCANRFRLGLDIVAVKSPGFGNRKKASMEDLAAITGATFISEEMGRKLSGIQMSELGKAKRVIVTRDSTTIVSYKSKEEMDEYIKILRGQIESSESNYEREQLIERIAKINNGVAVIKVGARTESEQQELKHRYEDAIGATKCAMEDGIVPGGGTALISAKIAIEKKLSKKKLPTGERIGWEIVLKALEAPLAVIAENSGADPGTVVEKVTAALKRGSPKYDGFDARSHRFVKTREVGIIDPTKVTKTALSKAASVVTSVLRSKGSIVEIKDNEAKD